MVQLILDVNSPGGAREIKIEEGDSVTIGRTEDSSVSLPEDRGLSRRHIIFSLENGCARAMDLGSTNGSLLNEELIPDAGSVLRTGDVLRIGNCTVVTVDLRNVTPLQEKETGRVEDETGVEEGTSLLKFLVPAIAVAIVGLMVVGAVLYSFTRPAKPERPPVEIDTTSASALPEPTRDVITPPRPESNPDPSPAMPGPSEPPVIAIDTSSKTPLPEETPPPAGQRKLYRNMSDDEKKEFIKQRAQHIAIMMGKRPYAFTPESLVQIKFWLDAFSRRAGNNRTGLWGGDTIAILQRGKGYAPLIIRSFREYGVPYVVGLYIPFIETEYNNISSNNAAGAAGLFQFLGPTAEGYGVPASERTNVAKMAPAAARYFRDNILSFGDDSMSVALSIAGYNRAPESVKRDLRNVLNAPNNEDKERSFWTLIANQGKLDEFFQRENVNYVPRFFAAAIFGETPWAFGIDMQPLSTYTELRSVETSSSPAE
jgi:hypothetical protein